MKQIGITTTVPIEVLLAAGYQPVDLNNIFITDPNPDKLVNIAERAGFPLNTCTWIKGIYGVCISRKIDTVLCVTTGDCSNTIMLMEVLKLKKLKVIPFAYPEKPDKEKMHQALKNLAESLGTTIEAAEVINARIKPARKAVWKLDELTWRNNQVTGYENHLWLVSSSDFNRDDVTYTGQLDKLVAECRQRLSYPDNWLRLGYIGVPPVFASDFFNYLEDNEAHVVFNEIQHQFSMPSPGESLAEQYTSYTYPYSIYDRLKDIKKEARKRHLDGIIHYVQAFCHRGIGDIIFRESLGLPMLTLEGNQEFYLTQHIKTRIEAFLDMIRRKRARL
ncbi:MAG: 2-hydroxyacyl-CoA dehydratase [Dehalococcoidales bacterium]|nr:2-hydroxyacyl-CoA dehydratase [Dehalococcoidales bacterium]